MWSGKTRNFLVQSMVSDRARLLCSDFAGDSALIYESIHSLTHDGRIHSRKRRHELPEVLGAGTNGRSNPCFEFTIVLGEVFVIHDLCGAKPYLARETSVMDRLFFSEE